MRVDAEHRTGPETDTDQDIQQCLAQHALDWNDLVAEYHTGKLPELVLEAVEAAGGFEKLGRVCLDGKVGVGGAVDSRILQAMADRAGAPKHLFAPEWIPGKVE